MFLTTVIELLMVTLNLARITIANPLNQTINHNLTTGHPHCTDSRYWTGPDFDHHDCDEALTEFLDTRVAEYEDTVFEFLAPGAIPSHEINRVKTPLKIPIGTCTMVIAMLESFRPGTLPGVGPQAYPPTDLASFRDIYFAALSLSVQCTRRLKQPGWSATGGRGSIGVFFWATESIIDRLVRNRVELVEPYWNALPAHLNGSSVE